MVQAMLSKKTYLIHENITLASIAEREKYVCNLILVESSWI